MKDAKMEMVNEFLRGLQGTPELETLTLEIRGKTETALGNIMRMPKEAVVASIVEGAARYSVSREDCLKALRGLDTKVMGGIILGALTLAFTAEALAARGLKLPDYRPEEDEPAWN